MFMKCNECNDHKGEKIIGTMIIVVISFILGGISLAPWAAIKITSDNVEAITACEQRIELMSNICFDAPPPRDRGN